MKISSVLRFVAALSLLVACGGGNDDASVGRDTAGGDDGAGALCAGHAADESCMGEDAMAACRDAEARCPGQVEVMESCPLQFACPGTEPAAEGGDCAPYSLDDACVNEDNLAECQARMAECPGEVQALESCPLQFACP